MPQAVFTQGSTLKHILIMTGASTIGLATMFSAELVDIYFLSLLGQQELPAAMGFAGTLLFFLTSVSIGLQIAMGALVARSEGARDRSRAALYCTNVTAFSLIFSGAICIPAWFYLEELLSFLGARGPTLEYALSYSYIILPSTPLLAMGMCASAALRAVGDAKSSMYVAIWAAVLNAILDPIFIFLLDWGIVGAAFSSLAARVVLFILSFSLLVKRHQLISPFSLVKFKSDLAAIVHIAMPAMMTNLATPIGSSFVLKTMADFGDSAVAGAAILGRLSPFVFVLVYALSGAVGPIIGQNAGAKRYDRLHKIMMDSLLVITVYVAIVWFVLFISRGWIIAAFDAKGDSAYLINLFCQWLAGAFIFNGMLFVANACFNNLNRALWSTLFNFGRVLLGTLPLVYIGANWYGVGGVIAGELAGAVLFGSLAYFAVLLHIKKLHKASQEMICDTR